MSINPRPIIEFIAWVLIVILCTWVIAGCSVVKDNRAVKRVIANEKLLDSVGKRWEKSNPCTSDSVTKFIFGQDSVRVDTLEISSVVVDTVNNVNTREILKYITKTIQRVDTIKKTLEDTRRLQLARQDISFRDGQIALLTSTVAKEKKRGDKWLYFFLGSITLGMVRIFIKYRYKLAWL